MAAMLAPIKGGMKKGKSKIMKPDREKNTVKDILKKNKKNVKKAKNSKLDKSKLSKANKGKPASKKKPRGRGRNGKDIGFSKKGKKAGKGGKGGKGKKGKKKKNNDDDNDKSSHREDEKEEIDPYQQLKQTDPNALIRMFLQKLVNYPFVFEHLGNFGDQLQSNMINFARDMILPTLMSLDNVEKCRSIINDRKLIYLLRQSFIRWLIVHRGQMKLIFKRKGHELIKPKFNIVVTKNHIIQKLSSTLNKDSNNIKDIISKLPIKTKLQYLHYLKSDIKNPFLAQLMTPIPNKLLSNTQCSVPSLSGKMPDMIQQNEEEKKKDGDMSLLPPIEQKEDQQFDNMEVQRKLHGLFDGYKDCVLLSEKQILVDILKTQYKLIQNAIDDYGKIRWMDAPIDHGHVRLMQREIIRDHEEIIKKCELIEKDYKRKLLQNINEVNKMMFELKKRKEVYLDLIENKCFRFLKEKLSAIHEEIERKKQAIALHEKKRENYLNHAKESLKNEQNMRKGVKLVNETYHKYLRMMTKAKVEYAEIDETLQSDDFYALQEKLNNLRNLNDRYWFWYKKEKEIYSKSIKAFSRLNRFFKKIENFLINEYGENSNELINFRKEYYQNVLTKVNPEALNNKYNKEIFEKKKITDIELVYNMKLKDIKLPPTNKSIVNRLYTNLKPKDWISDIHQRRATNDNQMGMMLNNPFQDDQDDDDMDSRDDTDHNRDDHEHRDSDFDDDDDEDDDDDTVHGDEQQDTHNYIKTNDDDIFGNNIAEEPDDDEYDESDDAQVIDDDDDDDDDYDEHRIDDKGYDEHEDEMDDALDMKIVDDDDEDEEVDDMDDDDMDERRMDNNNIIHDEQLMDDDIDDDDDDYDEDEELDTFPNEPNDDAYTKSFEQVIQSAAKARSSDKYEDTLNEQQLLSVKKTFKKKKGKRHTQNEWKGGVESTVFYGDGEMKDKDVSAVPHIAKHYSVHGNKLLEDEPMDGTQLMYEDSTPYQQDDDDEDDVNRPSSTIFKAEQEPESPAFFNDSQFFDENKGDNDEQEEDEEDEEEEEEDEISGPPSSAKDQYERRIKIDASDKHAKGQNSISVSGFGGMGGLGRITPKYATPTMGNNNSFSMAGPMQIESSFTMSKVNRGYNHGNIHHDDDDDDDDEEDEEDEDMSFEDDDDDDDDEDSYEDSDSLSWKKAMEDYGDDDDDDDDEHQDKQNEHQD